MVDEKAPAFTFEETTKRAPGRPKGSANKTPRVPTTTTAKDIAQALATLDTLYNVIGTGLLMAQLPKTLTLWIEKSKDLREQNEASLKAAPRLAKFIANAGQTGGAATFLAAHAVVGFSIVTSVRSEIAERRVVAEAEQARADGF